MEEMIQLWLRDKNDDHKILKCAQQIENREQTIGDLVTALGPHLTNKDTKIRIDACTLLSNVIHKLPKDCLNQGELESLVQFLCSRLEDHYTLQPVALSLLLQLSSADNLTGENACSIITSVFKEVHIQTCMQHDRLKIFQILGTLLDIHTKDVITMGRDFLYQYIQVIDGEQDPRNLLTIFQLTKNLIESSFPLFDLVEELFDVSSCYFPIDFNPAAAGKKSTITNLDLVSSLRGVLASTKQFAQYCIPLMLEKLESDVESAKIDSLETLTACLGCYGKQELEKYLSSLWSDVKREINQSSSEQIEKCCLTFLTSLLSNLSSWPVDQKSEKATDLKSFLDDVLEDCVPRLQAQSDDRSKWMAGHVVLACAKSSKKACSQIVTTVLPILLQNAQSKSASTTLAGQSVQQSALDNLVKLTAVCGQFNFENHPVLKKKEEFFTILNELALKSEIEEQLKCIAVAGFASLLKLEILSNVELTEIASLLLKMIKLKPESHLRGEVLSVAGYLSSQHPDVAKSHLIPCVMRRMEEGDDSCFDVLASVCTHFDVLKLVLGFIMERIVNTQVDETSEPLLHACLESLQKMTSSSWVGNTEIEYMALNLVLPLLKRCIEVTLELSVPEQCCANCHIFEDVSKECASLPILKSAAIVIRNVCQKLKPGKSTDLVIQLIASLYNNSKLSSLDIKSDVHFTPFHPKASPLQTRTLCFLPATICALHPNIEIPELAELETKLLNTCLHCTDQPSYVFAAKALSGLVNKYKKPSIPILEKLKSHFDTDPNWSLKSEEEKMMILTLLIWICKALVLSNHPDSLIFIKNLLYWMGDDSVGEVAAAGFDIILRESNEVLSPSSHSTIRLMHKQRFFLLIIPEIVSSFKTSENKTQQTNILTALSHLIGHLPKQVLMQHFTELLPLLTQALHTDNTQLLKSVLSTLFCFIQDTTEAMTAHLENLMKHFLRLSKFKQDIDVRVKAVQCIGVVTLLPPIVILPFKNDIVRHLVSVLDDRKRDVRTEASKARSEWFLVGT
nr:MMS19 nucleotide excision repair protein homolog isoform X2 [Ciona intestinalis]XP_026689740.1 MMS19 nucleotide excision repair protein homolog isoform X2 [Ciona intestinalis]|eukprot:XP_018666798.1 MMS19 nucleotide excision repair protein homolog isoform X2 [Ciona intestinalis]